MARLGRSRPNRPRWIRPVRAASNAASASGSITLGGSAAGQAQATTAGSITLGGSTTATAPTAASSAGSITLGGTTTGSDANGIRWIATGPIYQSGATASTGPHNIVSPTSCQVGDLLILHIAASATSATLTAGPTWTQLEPNWPIGSPGPAHGTFYRYADAADVAGSTTTVTLNSSQRMAGYIVALRNVDPVIEDVTTPAGTTSATGTVTAPSITTATANDMVVTFAAALSTAGVLTDDWTSTNMVELAQGYVQSTGNNPILAMYGAQVAAPGTFSPDVSMVGTVGRSSMLTIALRVAQAAPTAATAAGGITLGGTASAAAPAVSAGLVTLGGAPVARAVAAASGTVTLGGAATATPSALGAGSITLGGTAAATQSGTSSATGSISLSGTSTVRATATAAGLVSLSGTPAARAAATGAGVVTIGGAVTVRVPATVAGAISLNALANTGAVLPPTHTYATAVIPDLTGTAAVAAAVSSAVLDATVVPSVASLIDGGALAAVINADGVATLASGGSVAALQTTT